jgi:predicted RNA methylase
MQQDIFQKKLPQETFSNREKFHDGIKINLEPGHTPGRVLIPELLGSLEWLDDKKAQKLIQKLSHQGSYVAQKALEVFDSARRPQKSRLVSLFVLILTQSRPGDLEESLVDRLMETLINAHQDTDLKTRFLALNSAQVLGVTSLRKDSKKTKGHHQSSSHLDESDWTSRWSASILLEWEKEEKPMRPEIWRVFVRALTLVVDPRALDILEKEAQQVRRQVTDSDDLGNEADQELLKKSITILRRDLLRLGIRDFHGSGEERPLDRVKSPMSKIPPHWKVVFACRKGLVPLLKEEISLRKPWARSTELNLLEKKTINRRAHSTLNRSQVPSPFESELQIFWASCERFLKSQDLGPGSEDVEAQLAVLRLPTWTGLFWPVSSEKMDDPWYQTVDLWEQGLRDEASREFLCHLAGGTRRFRLDTSSVGAHQRSHIWQIVEHLNTLCLPLGWNNDPKEAPWTWHWCQFQGSWGWLLIPRESLKSRFDYRKQDVPASTHGPLAAALALLAQPTPEDVIWDPFCGAGTELLECGLLGTCREAWGFDTSRQALMGAEKNSKALETIVGKKMSINWTHQDAVFGSSFFKNLNTEPSLTITNPPYGKRVHRHQIQDFYDKTVPKVLKLIPHCGRLVWITPFREKTDALLHSLGFDIETSLKIDLGGFWGHLQKATRKSKDLEPNGGQSA